jgi:bacterioferritin (cytochrome b1)
MSNFIRKIANKTIVKAITEILEKALAAEYIDKVAYNKIAKICQDKNLNVPTI